MQELEKQARVEVLQKSSNMPRVVWTEESKTGLESEIGPRYDDVPTTSQCATAGQSSCRCVRSRLGSFLKISKIKGKYLH